MIAYGCACAFFGVMLGWLLGYGHGLLIALASRPWRVRKHGRRSWTGRWR